MGKDKLKRFAEMEDFSNVLQPEMEDIKGGHEWKGKWSQEFFGNDKPIILELGCGKGEYTVGLARRYKDYNFIGVDIKGARIWRGAKTCLEEGIDNAGFIRTKVDFIDQYFGENEVAEIWLTFSDPQPKRPRKRLTSPLFMARYKQFLRPDGVINVKTDSDLLFEYTLEQIEEHNYKNHMHSWDVYGELLPQTPEEDEIHYKMGIRTFYESKWLAQDIKTKYVRFSID
ncbi:tRNA (guanosine(46)-N7)-methyltransferase TrmB [Parvicella tangerina]|uniref:tRNA (guanine-N(7)-)-methyltransferase n=1 Tax=Parvicella tangerina TaxID=2829795 RepID=A0A916JPF2_9FLAO|nr:tRNA (guanosine(46)-N7)-methyltransferase TrmB [Parvicella tangerina]CAG5085655.1 tRNA (guanine-N(7)-)-methyltransferase [Parvicella tangerina]